MVNKSLTSDHLMLRTALVCFTCHATSLAAEGFVDRFTRLDPTRWHAAEYNFDHASFDTDWRRENINLSQGLELNLAPHRAGLNSYASGSIRTHMPLYYGYYETRLQAAKGDGLVTGFFTYTGPYYGTRHDEIDIEILGRDTAKLHLAWFVDGKLYEQDIPLSFDAASCLHSYGFLWMPDRIEWYVNGARVFVARAEDSPLPQIPGRLYANLWAADKSIAGWAGRTGANTRASARFRSISFRPLATSDGS